MRRNMELTANTLNDMAVDRVPSKEAIQERSFCQMFHTENCFQNIVHAEVLRDRILGQASSYTCQRC